MKRILIALALLLSACTLSSAQNFRSGYFLPDYPTGTASTLRLPETNSLPRSSGRRRSPCGARFP